MRATPTLLALIVVFVAACTTQPPPEQVVAELMAADRAFAAATAERGAEGWASHFANDAAMYQPQGVVHGREAIRDAMRPLLDGDGPALTWDPDTAIAAASGDLGYTLGRWRLRSADGGELGTGNYVTIWRRQPDGTWKVVVDIGNEDPAQAPDAS